MADFTNSGSGQQFNIPGNSGNIEINLSAKKDIKLNINIPKKLVPRDEMIANIQKEYDNGDNCVVVCGMGGYGKTSLAYLYAQEHNFDNVAWVTINGKIIEGFLQTMAEYLFVDADYNNFIHYNNQEAKLKNINRILSDIKGNNLLVLDINTDNDEIKQEIEEDIHNYLPTSKNWKTLVLTRVLAKNKDWFASIPMDKMTKDIAIILLNKNYEGDVDFSDEQLAEIVEELYYHPLLIEHTAKVYTDEFGITAEEILKQIKENKVNNERTKKALSGLAKEGKEKQDIYTYLINLCNIEKLSESQVKFLAVYVTWPEEPIDFEVIDTLLPNSKETLNNLIKKGIIIRNKQFSIHSLMADVIREQIKINEFDYTEYLDNVDKILRDDFKSVTLHKYSKCIASSFINYGICGDIVLFCNFLNKLLANNDVILYQLPIPVLADKFEENAEPYVFAHLYNTIARVEEFNNNLTDAKKHFEKALEMITSAEENYNTLDTKGSLLSNLAYLEENLVDTDSAKKHYEKSLEIGRKLPKTPDYLSSLAITIHNLAHLENKLGNTDSAKKHYEESLKIERKLPGTPQNLNSLAITINNLALLEEKLGDTYSAKKHYDEAVKIGMKLPETPEYLDRFGTSLNNLARLEEKLGDNKSAKKHYEEALEIIRKLPETTLYLYSFADTLNNLAGLEDDLGDTDSAKKHFEEAVAIERQLPETSEYVHNLANALAGLANVEAKLGDINSAKMHYEEGLEISRRSGNEEDIKFFEYVLS
ncbi:MAG: tetratricopeptide repeat protein [Bacteroidales bacterium]|nr:tetratricopeptide repeat protein [Bacteroidales bacterium]